MKGSRTFSIDQMGTLLMTLKYKENKIRNSYDCSAEAALARIIIMRRRIRSSNFGRWNSCSAIKLG